MRMFCMLLALAWPLPGLAQTAQPQVATAANPDMPGSTIRYRPLAPTGASALVDRLDDWKAANTTVGQYHGHSDIVRWERAQPAPAAQHPTDHARPPQEPAR